MEKFKVYKYNQDKIFIGEFEGTDYYPVEKTPQVGANETLKKPTDIPEGQVAFFDEEKDKWIGVYYGGFYNKTTQELKNIVLPKDFSKFTNKKLPENYTGDIVIFSEEINDWLVQKINPIWLERKKNELILTRQSILNENKDTFIKMFRNFLLEVAETDDAGQKINEIALSQKTFCENDLRIENEITEINNATSLQELEKFE